MHDPDGVRLQRVLASAGMGSRRACELLIDEGRVEVDGAVVTEQGLRVDPSHAVIKVDGMRIQSAPDLVYLMLNKPTGVVSTMSDPEGRPVAGRLRGRPQRPPLPRRAARRRHRGPAAADQRRRARPPAGPPVVRRREDLPRRDHRAGCARRRQAAQGGSHARGRAGPGRLVPAGRHRRARASWSRCRCTRGASTSYAAC